MWNDVLATLNHLARRFGETGLVPIDERNAPRPDRMEKNAAKKQQRVID